MSYNYLYVLDYSQGEIYEIKLDEIDKQKMDNDNLDVEELLDEYGLNIDNCHYLFINNKLELNCINKLQ